tara:strand:+ start:314 stop:613 length:300 start_codon:yes stop_codon:yes gene_type:complete
LIENQYVDGSNPSFDNVFKQMILFFLLDSSTPWQMSFQDAATPVMEGIINLHHDLMFFITLILFFVLVVLIRTLLYFHKDSNISGTARNVVHGTTIEII